MFRKNFSNRPRFYGNQPHGFSPLNNYRNDGFGENFDFTNDQSPYYGHSNAMGEQNNGYMPNQRETNFMNFANFATQNSRIHSTSNISSPYSGIDLSSRWPSYNSMNQQFNSGQYHSSDSGRVGLPNMQIFNTPSMSGNIPSMNPAMTPTTNHNYQANLQGTVNNSMFSGISNDQSFRVPQTPQTSSSFNVFPQNLSQQKSISGIVNTCKLPPYEQVAGIKNRNNVNPFIISSVGRDFGDRGYPVTGSSGLTSGTGSFAEQPGQFVMLNNPQFHMNSGPMNSTQQYKVQIWQKLRSEVDNDTSSLQRNWKLSNYELLPTDERKYSMWRSSFLLQCDIDNGCHVLYNKDYVPLHLKFPEPDPNDPEFEGRHELYTAAVELWQAYLKNHEAKVKIQAKAIKHAIGDHPIASTFVKHNNIDPMQILNDMDKAFLQNSHMTKGTAMFDFWNLRKDSEPWSVFFAKQDRLHMDAYNMFDIVFTDDDKASVLQMNLPVSLQPTYSQLVNAGKTYSQIREELIALETLEKRTRKAHAHAVRDFNRSRYDRQHVPRDAPQSGHWRNRDADDDDDNRRSQSPMSDRS